MNRTMLTFGPPFLLREAPHLFALLLTLGLVRTAPHLRANVNTAAPIAAAWVANGVAIATLVGIFRRMARVGATPFRDALRAAHVAVPRASEAQEDVLTIVPVQQDVHEPIGMPEGSDPLQVSAFADAAEETAPPTDDATPPHASAPHTPPPAMVTSTSPSLLPTSTAEKAYSRIGRMTPLRWFLSWTQLTKTLAWFEEIQWRTGVVYEKLHTRQKTHALKLDLYRPKVMPAGALLPVFLYIHGGGWVTGHRSFHSLAMLYAIAKAGFLVVSVNYRLSPWVKHPTHLMDCKRALAWLRTHARAYGGDASFVVVGGESAGAHLACLLALTPNVLHLQPGLEHIDTSVQGCVDLYGCHDFTDANFHFRCREDPHAWFGGFGNFLHRVVMGAGIDDARELYEMASPLFRLQTTAAAVPPFFAAHGTHDELIPIEDSQDFYDQLAKKREEEAAQYDAARAEYLDLLRSLPAGSPRPLPPIRPPTVQDVFVSVPHASHSFNNVLGPRSFALNDAVTVWLSAVLKAHRAREQRMQRRHHRRPTQEELGATVDSQAVVVDIRSARAAGDARHARSRGDDEATNFTAQVQIEMQRAEEAQRQETSNDSTDKTTAAGAHMSAYSHTSDRATFALVPKL